MPYAWIQLADLTSIILHLPHPGHSRMALLPGQKILSKLWEVKIGVEYVSRVDVEWLLPPRLGQDPGRKKRHHVAWHFPNQ